MELLIHIAFVIVCVFMTGAIKRIGRAKGWQNYEGISLCLLIASFVFGFTVNLFTTWLTGYVAAIIALMGCLVWVWCAEGRAEPQADELLKKCPFCAEIIRAEAVKCRHCGSFLNPEPSNENAEEWQTVFMGKENLYQFSCCSCGKEVFYPESLAGSVGHCVVCGNEMQLPDEAPLAPPHIGNDGNIWFTCQHCGTQLATPQINAGKTLPCRGCRNPIRIPSNLKPPLVAKIVIGNIEFSCSECGQPLTVEEKGAGEIIECPACHQDIQIPTSSQ